MFFTFTGGDKDENSLCKMQGKFQHCLLLGYWSAYLRNQSLFQFHTHTHSLSLVSQSGAAYLRSQVVHPEQCSAMKFWYNQSDQSSHTFTKFDQNPTYSKRDISRKSGADTDTDRHTDKVCRSIQSTDCDNIDPFHPNPPLTPYPHHPGPEKKDIFSSKFLNENIIGLL